MKKYGKAKKRLTAASAVFWVALLPLGAYIEREFHLAEIIEQSTNIVLLRVQSVDEKGGKIIYEVVPDGNLKGSSRFNIIQDYLFSPNGIRSQANKILALVKPGDSALLFYQEDGQSAAAEKHVAGLWYQTHGQINPDPNKTWWYFTHEEIYLDRTFSGATAELSRVLAELMQGKEVEITRAFSKSDKSLVRARIRPDGWITDPRDFKFLPVHARVVQEGKQFARQVALPATAGPGRGASVADYNLDGRLDAYLCNTDGSRLFRQNEDGSWESVTRESGLGPASAGGVWADYAGSGRPSLLISSTPPRLFTNLPGGRFRDDTEYYLPKLSKYNVGGVAWLDYNRDGWPDILLANAQYGLFLYENRARGRERFVDVSEKVGLGEKVGASGNFITTAAVTQKEFADFLFHSGAGVFFANRGGKRFERLDPAGFQFNTSPRVGVAWGDYDNDGDLDLFIPQSDRRGFLLRNDGEGKFTDVTDSAGDLATRISDRSVCAVWGDFNNDGWLDLFVGNIGQPNRLYLSNGDGTFKSQTTVVGLGEISYDTTSAVPADFDRNGTLDLLVNNLGQNALIFFNDLADPPRAGVTFCVRGTGAIGATVEVFSADGKLLAYRQTGIATGFGSQEPTDVFAALPTGQAKVVWRGTHGRTQQRTIDVRGPAVHVLDITPSAPPVAQGLRG